LNIYFGEEYCIEYLELLYLKGTENCDAFKNVCGIYIPLAGTIFAANLSSVLQRAVNPLREGASF